MSHKSTRISCDLSHCIGLVDARGHCILNPGLQLLHKVLPYAKKRLQENNPDRRSRLSTRQHLQRLAAQSCCRCWLPDPDTVRSAGVGWKLELVLGNHGEGHEPASQKMMPSLELSGTKLGGSSMSGRTQISAERQRRRQLPRCLWQPATSSEAAACLIRLHATLPACSSGAACLIGRQSAQLVRLPACLPAHPLACLIRLSARSSIANPASCLVCLPPHARRAAKHAAALPSTSARPPALPSRRHPNTLASARHSPRLLRTFPDSPRQRHRMELAIERAVAPDAARGYAVLHRAAVD